MKTATRLITLTVLLSGSFFGSFALACSTDAWTTAAGGAIAGDPVVEGIARVSGTCGLKIPTDGGHVADNSPADETVFIGRFYFYPKGIAAGTNTIFAALSDEGNSDSDVFRIDYDGTNIILDATAATGGGSTSVAADTTHWNLIEFSWTSGGQGSLWVNADALTEGASSTFASGTGSIDRVEMGGAEGALFDDYESHRSLAVGSLLIGDSNGNGSINVFDLISIQNDILGNSLANGQPDCNLNGSVNVFDLICTQNIILGN